MAQKVELIVMRTADMHVEHPNTDYSHVCAKCHEPVGIYPSGQRIIKRYDAVLICNRCYDPEQKPAVLAPGALEERLQSRRVRRRS